MFEEATMMAMFSKRNNILDSSTLNNANPPKQHDDTSKT